MALGGVAIAYGGFLPDTDAASPRSAALAVGGALVAVGRLIKSYGDHLTETR